MVLRVAVLRWVVREWGGVSFEGIGDGFSVVLALVPEAEPTAKAVSCNQVVARTMIVNCFNKTLR